jgi:hypothetical protein
MLTESKEHIDCKERLAEITNCKKEVYITPKQRVDVACSKNVFFEVKCKKATSGQRICEIETIIRVGEKEYRLGELDCEKLHS